MQCDKQKITSYDTPRPRTEAHHTTSDAREETRRLLIAFDNRGELSDEEHLAWFQRVEAHIDTLLAEREREARIDELRRIGEANKGNGISFWFKELEGSLTKNNGWRKMAQYIPERIAELEGKK